MTLIITRPDPDGAPHIHEVRFHPDGERHFSASFNVTELDGGRTIRASMFTARDGSPPPGHRWFLAFASEHFPRAEFVGFERMRTGGSMKPFQWRLR